MSSSAILFDDRWIGPHGIGRFAEEVSNRCGFFPAHIQGKALDLLDPWLMRRELLLQQPKHFFTPGFNAPLGNPCSFSMTVHDLIHLEVVDERSFAKSLYYKWVVLPALRKADVVFTVSEYSRIKLADWSGIKLEQIVNVGNGVAEAYNPLGDSWPSIKPYLLYVGNQKPHKNVEGLIAAYAVSMLRDSVDLVLTGGLSYSVRAAIGRHGIEANVVTVGFVPESELPKLYRGAFAVVMPSRYEGFGLPVVEAMASGTPVLSSNSTSLPEVGGDAVSYFDPDDFESFVDGLNALQSDSFRQDLRAKGLKRSTIFEWDKVANGVLEAINQRVSLDRA